MPSALATTTLVSLLAIALAQTASAQSGSVFVDAKCNIFGYGVTTPGSSFPGIIAITIPLTPGTNRTATFSSSGGATWHGGTPNGPDGGASPSTINVIATPPVSGYAAPASGSLLGLFVEAESPVGLPTPANFSYPNAAAMQAAAFSPLNRQVFFIGDGLTGTGSGAAQVFHIPDNAARLVLGYADANLFNGPPGLYHNNTGGFTAQYTVVPGVSVAGPSFLILCAATARRRTRR